MNRPDDSWLPAIGRTRNPDRIPIILEALRREWEKSPDARFGQLLNNILQGELDHNPPLARLEDYKLFELIEEWSREK